MVQRTYIECDHCKKKGVMPPNYFQVHIDDESDIKDLCTKCWTVFSAILEWLGIQFAIDRNLREATVITISRAYLDTGCEGET